MQRTLKDRTASRKSRKSNAADKKICARMNRHAGKRYLDDATGVARYGGGKLGFTKECNGWY